ncbi:MAG: hypothetical protein U0K92_07685 [Treponema sp.]|nr:hypothetical protein [Treponema sp.]
MKKKILAIFFLAFISSFTFAENVFGKQIFSVDTSFLLSGLDKFGWGIDVTYEREIFKWFAVKGGFGHATSWYFDDDLILTSVSVSGDLLYYPFARGLDWLYLGAQCKTGFFMYNGDNFNKENNQDVVISVSPIIGWKQTFMKSIMVDAFVGYRFVLNPGTQNPLIEDHLKNSIEYGVRFKVDLIKLFKYSVEKLVFPLK